MNPIDEDVLLGKQLPDKKQLTLAPQASPLTPELALMDCGDFSIFIPSNEIISLVSSAQLVAQPRSSFDCGYLEFEQQYYAIFCLNKALQLQSSIAAAHSTIVLLRDRNILWGISCHELIKQASPTLSFYSVPPSMRSRKQPFTEFTIINHRAVGLSSTAALSALLRLRGAKLVAQQNLTTVLQGAG